MGIEKVNRNKKASDQSAGADSVGDGIPVVGIGASAGGLRAFEHFLEALPDRTGMAYILVQHLVPDHESALAELLQNHTSMQVMQIHHQLKASADHVYVIPPGKNLFIEDGVFHLSDAPREYGGRMPIDVFFRSLAEDQEENAIGIVLSGTGTDGTLGIKTIKECGGVTMAQAPDDAEYDGMPQSAIRTNLVDFMGSTSELAAKLMDYRQGMVEIHLPQEVEELSEDDSVALTRIFAHLQAHTDHNFTHYKRSTILRRIGRRLQMNQVTDIHRYQRYLRENPDEVDALFKDFLISVTNFFRDPDAFEMLALKVIPALFKRKTPQEHVRVWVPGCATGEEAYSIAMLLLEYAEQAGRSPNIQIFATDIDENALVLGRAGLYDHSIAADVSPQRLERFFKEEDGGYRVSKKLRESVLFAEHNLIKDPPFSRLDLISCRNLLIYLNRNVQDKTFEIFHYALRADGYLFLGSSESADSRENLFAPLSKKDYLYEKRTTPNTTPSHPFLAAGGPEEESGRKSLPDEKEQPQNLEELYSKWILRRYAPPRILVNDRYEIAYVFGDAGKYLRDREGPATQNILQKVLEPLQFDLRSALYQSFHKSERLTSRMVPVELDGETQLVRLHVGPVGEPNFPSDYIEVVFEEREMVEFPPESLAQYTRATEGNLVERLEEELQRTRDRLQTTVEEQETSTEELRASYAELQSLNEELQSTTEELETGKEELQSLNEELVAVNQELKNKIEELSRANSDLQNLIESTNIGTLFLDRELRVKLFTPAIIPLFNVISADIGRPFAHLSHVFGKSLSEQAQRVLENLNSFEEVLQSSNGRWYGMRMFPYRTVEDRINGVVVTFVDITKLKDTEQELRIRVQQQMTVATLGHRALERIDLQQLLEEVVQKVQQTLNVKYCKVLQLRPEQNDLLLLAGVGWHEGYVGRATVGTNRDSQAGYTLESAEPVIVENLAEETRFTGPSLLVEHDVVSGMSVVIPGIQRPFGVFGIHHTEVRQFNQHDANFLAAVANLLAESVERRRYEEQLAFHAKLLSNIQDAVIATDTELKVTAWNRGAEIMYGWMEKEALGRSVSDLIRSELSDTERRELLKTLSSEGTYHSELVTRHRRGHEISTEALTTVLTDSSGAISGYLSINRDITKRKQAEEAQRTSQEQLRALASSLEERVSERTAELAQAVEELDRFAYIASHDLRTPLRSVDNLATWIEEDSGSKLDETSLGHLRTMRQRIRRMENLLNDLLAYSRIDRNLQEMEVVNTNELIQDVLDVIPIPNHITLDVQEPMPTLLTDHAPLELVLRNLIDNAIKHHWSTPETGQGHVWVSAREVGDFWEFTVRDDGPGIPSKFHKRIFQMFRTLQPRDQVEGSGMGLSFVAKVVENRGGQVSVESEEGKGATFRFTWPHRKV